jgi:hypothetical protein
VQALVAELAPECSDAHVRIRPRPPRSGAARHRSGPAPRAFPAVGSHAQPPRQRDHGEQGDARRQSLLAPIRQAVILLAERRKMVSGRDGQRSLKCGLRGRPDAALAGLVSADGRPRSQLPREVFAWTGYEAPPGWSSSPLRYPVISPEISSWRPAELSAPISTSAFPAFK